MQNLDNGEGRVQPEIYEETKAHELAINFNPSNTAQIWKASQPDTIDTKEQPELVAQKIETIDLLRKILPAEVNDV